MYRMFRNAGYAAYLVLFTAYAVSPVYADAARLGKGNDLHSRANVQMGILSVKVVLSSLIGELESPRADGGSHLSTASQDDELLLVQKKRAIIREHGALRPVLQTTTLPSAASGPTTAFSREHTVPDDSICRSSDGFIHHATGLSPPFLLS